MSTIDIILLVPLLIGAYKGYKKGFFQEVVAILAFILAIVGGFKLLHVGMDLLDEYFSISGEILPYIAFILIFLIIIIGVSLLGKAIKKILDLTLLGTVDNFAGMIVSVLKWTFGLSVLFWLSSSVGIEPSEEMTEGAYIYPVVVGFAPKVVSALSAVLPFATDLFDMIKTFLQGDTSA